MEAISASVFTSSLDPGGGPGSGRPGVASPQRARMLEAVTRAVVDKGYARVTVADIVAGAEVSRRTFYQQFENKEDCFLAAYEAGAQAVMADILAALAPIVETEGWRTRTRIALEVFTSSLAASPDFARVFLVDVLGAGHRAVELRQRVHDLFAEWLGRLALRAGQEERAIGAVPDLALHALVGAIEEVVQRHILHEGAASLGELAPALSQVAIQMIEGAGGIERGERGGGTDAGQ